MMIKPMKCFPEVTAEDIPTFDVVLIAKKIEKIKKRKKYTNRNALQVQETELRVHINGVFSYVILAIVYTPAPIPPRLTRQPFVTESIL